MTWCKTHWILCLAIAYVAACVIDAKVLSLGLGRANILRGMLASAPSATAAPNADATAGP